MLSQHTREEKEREAFGEGIFVPLNLPEFQVLGQVWNQDGSLKITVMAKSETAMCPRCQSYSHQIHDRRERLKRDLMLREYRVNLIVIKRRFRCCDCSKTFTEPDTACGRRRRTTMRLRETIGKQAATQPVEQVAQTFGVGPRFVRDCFQSLSRPTLE